MTYFVYLLQCDDGTLYTGITTNLERRLKKHQNKLGGRYTRSRGAQKIVHSEEYPNKSTALRREAEIKGWRREMKLALIELIDK